MQIPPAEVLATLPAPNYIDPVERPPVITAVNVVLLPLCVTIIGLRIFSRTRIAKSFGMDDVLIVLAVLPTIPFCVISVMAELHYGWDRHVWDVPQEQIELGLRLILACECLFAASCTFTKLSVLVFIRRMLHNTNSKTRQVALVAMVIIAAQGTTFCFLVVFKCNPISDYWKLTPFPQPNCLNQPANLLAAGIVNTLTDLCVVVIPIPVVMGLKLPIRQQILCLSLFSAGLIVCTAGAVRTWAMWAVSQTIDQTWAGYKVWLTGAVEMYLAILCACLPALKAFTTRYFPRLLGTFTTFGRNFQSYNRSFKSPATLFTDQSTSIKHASYRSNVLQSPAPPPVTDWEQYSTRQGENNTHRSLYFAENDSIMYPAPVMMQHMDARSVRSHDCSVADSEWRTKSIVSERSDSGLV